MANPLPIAAVVLPTASSLSLMVSNIPFDGPVAGVVVGRVDGEYIISWLLNNGYECIKDKKDRHDKSFTTLITDMGQWFSIEIFFETKNKETENQIQESIILNYLNEAFFKIKETLSRCGNTVYDINSKKEVLKQYGNIAKVINMMIEENEKTKNKE